MPWPERDQTSQVLAGIVGAILLGLLTFIALAYNLFTFHSSTSLPMIGAGVGAVVGFVAGFVGGDAAVRTLARLFGRGRGAA